MFKNVRMPLRASFACSLALSFTMISAQSKPALADWKDELGAFRVGIVGGSDPATLLAKVEPFRLALEEKLEVPVSFLPTPDLRSLILAHAEGRNEYAILSASAYASAFASCECLEPLVSAKSADGSYGVYSIIITRKNTGLNSINDLPGKKIVALGKNSTLGYSYPIFSLQKQNVDLMKGETEFLFAETADKALARFANGEGDALIGWSSRAGEASTGYSRGTLRQLADANPGILAGLTVLWTSDLVPQRVHSIKKNLVAEPKKRIKELLLQMFETDPVAFDVIEPDFNGGFTPVAQSDFSQLVEFAKSPIPKPLLDSGDASNAENETTDTDLSVKPKTGN
ncbi:MAG: phosphate/phosphite/phosphonate ABC transporter substrate-binding protein [Salaquimonas sp.]